MGADDSVREDDARSAGLLEVARKSFDPATKIVAVSGGFDPLHVGHIRMIEDAARYGQVCVILNSDAWLKRKKGYAFMSWYERYVILMALRPVRWVVPVDDDNDTVARALREVKPHFFANGGDRRTGNEKEHRACYELGITELFGIGGKEKMQSSSALVNKIKGAK